jgi:hypothetical protein
LLLGRTGLGDGEVTEWNGLLAVRLTCSAWKRALAPEFVTSFTIDHYQLPQFVKALKLNPELGASVNGFTLV